jgi:hypothetical protein
MADSRASWAASMWGALQRPAPPLSGRHRLVLAAVLLACFAARFGIAWRFPNIHQPDEVYMVAEQANRAASGYGIVPWEFRTASRAALLPTLVEPIFRLHISAASRRLVQSALFCALSLIPVWVAFHCGATVYDFAGAVLAAAVVGMWFELVYFAPKATADAVCSYFLIAAIYLARPSAPRIAVFIAGFCLILALAIRVQIAPAVTVLTLLALMIGGRQRTNSLLAGAVAGLTVAGIVEWQWWGTPFQGQIGYLATEFTRHVSRFFGREPVTFYVKHYVLMYGAALPLIAFLICVGARKAPVLLVVALTVIVPFHFIGHKEYRFVVSGLPPLVLLIALGASEIMKGLGAATTRAALGLAGGWLIAMIAVSLGDTYRPLWTLNRNHIFAFEEIGRQPDACGVALVGIYWWQTPGYSGLGRDIPIYEIPSEDHAVRLRSAANYVLEATAAEPPPAPYERWREYTRPLQYLYRRPGGCVPDRSAQVVAPPGIPGIE